MNFVSNFVFVLSKMSPTLQWLGRLFQSANRFRSIKLSLHTKTRHIFRPKIVLSYFFSTRPAPTTPTNFLRLRFSFLLYFWLKSDLGQFKSNSPATQPLKWTKVLNFSPSRTFHRRKFHQNISTIFNFIESHDGHELAD